MQEVLLSLSYLPSAERLTVVMLKARNLFRPSAKYSIGALSGVLRRHNVSYTHFCLRWQIRT
jgi:hypothetical protein